MFATGDVEKLIRHLVRFGSSPSDAEDMAQETLVIAWRKRDQRDPARSLDAWLYGIARNVYRNHARSLRRRPPVDDASDLDSHAHPTTGVAEALSLRDALQVLPENQQDIVIIHELEQHTLKETAELLGVPFDTAKDRLKRARAALRDHMRAELPAAAADERRDTAQIARGAIASVLAGVLALLARSGAAAAAGAAGAVADAAAAADAPGAAPGPSVASPGPPPAATAAAAKAPLWGSKLVLAAAVSAGIVTGVVADRVLAPRAADPAPVAALRSAPVARAGSPPPALAIDASPAEDAGATPSTSVGAASPDAGAGPAAAPGTIAARAQAALPASAPEPVARPAPPADAPGAAPGASGVSGARIDPEAQVIEQARSALARGRFDDALRALMSHERRFATGQLAEERDVLVVEAYLAAGDLRLARQRADHYLATYPAGLYRSRVNDAAREIDRRRASPPTP
jgi:RNA polymerase sigma-70 factor (ECF subfamily)